MSSLGFGLLAVSTLFVIVNPLAEVPAFLAMTQHDTPEQRIRTARLACSVTAAVLLVFALVGTWIFKALGITRPAFQLAASVVLLLVAGHAARSTLARLLDARGNGCGCGKRGHRGHAAGHADARRPRRDLDGDPPAQRGEELGGPARSLRRDPPGRGGSYVILRVAARGASWLSPIALRIATRVMGLLLAAVAFQFMRNAFQTVTTHIRS